jgi:hypothetical protein
MVWRRAIKGIFVFTVVAIVMGFSLETSFAKGQEGSPLDQSCNNSEIPCSQRCGPAVLKSYSANGTNYVVMGESAQINLLAGKSTEFGAVCQPGFVALSGGYKLVEEGTTIDLDEFKVTGSWAENNPHTNRHGWKVWVHRDKSGAPDNCLNLEVHTTCVQAQ